MPELVSELRYAGYTFEEIARLTDYQIRWIIYRPRDQQGKLKRYDPDMPPWVEVDEGGQRVVNNPVPFARMFKDVAEKNWKLKRDAVRDRWRSFITDNPDFTRHPENAG